MSVIDITNPNSSNGLPFFSYIAFDAIMCNIPFLTTDREGSIVQTDQLLAELICFLHKNGL